MTNRLKAPGDWQQDIVRSVAEYDRWYLTESPGMFVHARERAVVEVAEAMRVTDNFRRFNATSLIARPGALFVARMCVSPPMARDRFVGFSKANKALVTAMERDGVTPANARNLHTKLQAMCDFLHPLFDPVLFQWLAQDRAPTANERDRAVLIVAERLTSALYLPVLRNEQETRQKAGLGAYLQNEGFQASRARPFEMPSGTFSFGRNVQVLQGDGALCPRSTSSCRWHAWS